MDKKRLIINEKQMSNKEFSDALERANLKGWGFGRTFNHIRKMKKFELWSDIIIFRLILFEFKKLNKNLSKSKMLHHFRTKISKEDYAKEDKSEILRDLDKLE